MSGIPAAIVALLNRILTCPSEEGKRKGLYRKDLDTRVAKMIIFGAAQGILLSWVLSESPAVKSKTFKFSLYQAAKTLKDVFKSGLVGEKK